MTVRGPIQHQDDAVLIEDAINIVTSNNTAADLRIATVSTSTNGGGQQIIDGRTSLEIDLSTLEIPDKSN